jgi:hypothetical protein
MVRPDYTGWTRTLKERGPGPATPLDVLPTVRFWLDPIR